MRIRYLAALAAAIILVPALLSAQGTEPAEITRVPFRPPVMFTDEPSAPPIPADVTNDRRVARNYPEQPPVIPHNVRDYQINLNTNRCLTCHSRQFSEAVQAPMMSTAKARPWAPSRPGAISACSAMCRRPWPSRPCPIPSGTWTV
jgi:cytochrome c-type protein NapB